MVDILCIQEHWMFSFEENMLKALIPNICYHIKCSDDKRPVNPTLKPRGQGGVLTLWKPEMECLVTPLPDGSERNVLIQIGSTKEGATYLLNSYMPTEGSLAKYVEVLDEVYEIQLKHSPNGRFIWIGDLNASFTRPNPTENDKAFRKFCSEQRLTPPSSESNSIPTYHHFVGAITSRIDHVLTHKASTNILSNSKIMTREPLNLSSHDPILIQIQLLKGVSTGSKSLTQEARAKKKPNWPKVDIPKYTHTTGLRLDSLINTDGLTLPTEVLVERINNILLQSADECGPPAKKAKKRKSRYPWSGDMKPFVKQIKHAYYCWKTQGKKPDHPLVEDIKQMKKTLRSEQRQLAAEHRRSLLTDISKATVDNKQLFFRLIKRQRGCSRELCNSVEFPPECETQLEGWASYYEKLATAESLPHFDDEHHKAMQLKHHLVALQMSRKCQAEDPAPIDESTIQKHIKSLKNRKAADVFGLTSEHIKLAAPQLIHIITVMANNIQRETKLPCQFKIGAIAPTLKKSKPLKNPDSYRRITMASTLGKVVEREMMRKTKPHSKANQDPMQYGFTEECSPAICALMITEAIAESKDLNKPLYVTFMDSSKAFDMVDHTALLTSLYDLHLEPHLWKMYDDMYSTVISRVRVNGMLSREIREGRGIRQGGETSTEGFKAKENSFLKKVRTHPDSMRIGSIPIGIPTVADDNCMLSNSHNGAQTQLLLAQQNAARVRYVFSTTKSRVLYIPDTATKGNSKPPLVFNNSNISYSPMETHLGLARTEDGKPKEAVLERIQAGRRTAYALMGAGLHGVNGLSPHISKNLVSIYVNPAVLYGLETLTLQDSDISSLDQYHRGLLRQLQSLPESTAKPAIHLLLGCLPLQALIHQKILNLYNSILHRPGTPEYQIILRQLTIKDLSSHSWTVQLRKVLHQYSLPLALQLSTTPPAKDKWKSTVKVAVTEYWEDRLKREATGMKSLKHLNLDMCAIGYSHPVWKTGPDPIQATMATVKAAMLVGRYPLSGHKCAGKRQLPSCPQCNLEPETIQHFLLKCPAYQDIRSAYIPRLEQDLSISMSAFTDDQTVSIILDPSHITADEDLGVQAETTSRRMCYAMHNRRAVTEGRGSMYQWASKRARVKGINKTKSKLQNSKPKSVKPI